MKVFGIGLSRTGTRSLVEALRLLGFNAVHFPKDLGVFDKGVNAGADLSVALNYKELYKKYPDARFILTVRDLNDWLDSCEWQWHKYPPNPSKISGQYCKQMYGSVEFNRVRFACTYMRWVEEVAEFFLGNGRMMVLNICNTKNSSDYLWVALLRFLDMCDSPAVKKGLPDFPRSGEPSNPLNFLKPLDIIRDLESLTKVESQYGCTVEDDYSRGMLNGLIVAMRTAKGIGPQSLPGVNDGILSLDDEN